MDRRRSSTYAKERFFWVDGNSIIYRCQWKGLTVADKTGAIHPHHHSPRLLRAGQYTAVGEAHSNISQKIMKTLTWRHVLFWMCWITVMVSMMVSNLNLRQDAKIRELGTPRVLTKSEIEHGPSSDCHCSGDSKLPILRQSSTTSRQSASPMAFLKARNSFTSAGVDSPNRFAFASFVSSAAFRSLSSLLSKDSVRFLPSTFH